MQFPIDNYKLLRKPVYFLNSKPFVCVKNQRSKNEMKVRKSCPCLLVRYVFFLMHQLLCQKIKSKEHFADRKHVAQLRKKLLNRINLHTSQHANGRKATLKSLLNCRGGKNHAKYTQLLSRELLPIRAKHNSVLISNIQSNLNKKQQLNTILVKYLLPSRPSRKFALLISSIHFKRSFPLPPLHFRYAYYTWFF